MSRSADGRVRCGLCGFVFDPDALACHDGCPLGPRCRLICCPNCGYEVPDEATSASARFLSRFRRPRRRAPASPSWGAVPLSALGTGTSAAVRSLDGMPPGRSARLSALGLVPGVKVTLRQRRPVPVVRVGNTEIALSDEILEEILVAADPAGTSRS